jgi:hypothetical protein
VLRERCEQDGEQTAPPVLAQPLQCFPPAKLRCDVSANYDKDGSDQPTIRAAPIIAEVKPFASSGGGDIVGVDLISCRARKLYLRQCFVGHLDLSEQTFASLDAAPGTYCERGAPGRTPTASPLTSLQLRYPSRRGFCCSGRPRRAGVGTPLAEAAREPIALATGAGAAAPIFSRAQRALGSVGLAHSGTGAKE